MTNRLFVFVVCVALGLSGPAFAKTPREEAEEILDTMLAKERERTRNVEDYVVDQWEGNNRVVLWYQKNRNGVGYFLVPPHAISGTLEQEVGLTPGNKAKISGGMLLGGMAIGNQFIDKDTHPMIQALSADLLAGTADFLEAANIGPAHVEEEAQRDARQNASHMREFARVAKFEGMDSIDGKPALLLAARGLNRIQRTEDGEFTLDTVQLWLDPKMHVLLGLRMEGVFKSGNESRDVTILRRDHDYRQRGSMYFPFKQTLGISGLLGSKEKKRFNEVAKRADIEQLRARMASLPPAQRAMMMRMVGPQLAQLDQLESMAENNEIRIERTVNDLAVNGGIVAYKLLLERMALEAQSGGK